MTGKVERAGQRIGDLVVLPDEGVRTKRGAVLWPVRNLVTGNVKYTRTYALSRLAREAGVPKPDHTAVSREHATRVAIHRVRLGSRSFARLQSAEDAPPVGEAGLWYDRVVLEGVEGAGRNVARQIARLAGSDMQLTIPWRSLADAVGKVNSAGHLVSYTERGSRVLEENGLVRVETVGRGRSAKTTWYLV